MTLFIGGPLDGVERDIGTLETYQCAARSYEEPVLPRVTAQYTYLRYRIYDVDFCMLHTALVPHDLLKILLAAYPRKR